MTCHVKEPKYRFCTNENISVLTITMGFGSYFLHLIEVSKLPGFFSVKFTKYGTIKRILLLLFVDSSSKT